MADTVISARVPQDLFDRVEAFVTKHAPEKGGRTRTVIAALESYISGGTVPAQAQKSPEPISVNLSRTCLMVLNSIRNHGPSTSMAVAADAKIPATSAAKRIQELVAMGYIKDSGQQQKSPNSSAMLRAWVATEKEYKGEA